MERHLEIIAADSMQGRGFGTEGLKKAARYVAAQYERIGLKPVNKGSLAEQYFQPVTEFVDDRSVSSQNVVGMIEGSDEELGNEAIIVMAHLDHLGIDSTLTGDNIYNGASDNASGVAACILLADAFSQAKREGVQFKRSLIFLNTTGEEKHGRAGSRHYVQNNPSIPLEKTVAAINMDGVAGLDTANLPNNTNYVYIVNEDSTSIDLRKRNERINAEAGINMELVKPPFSFGSDQMVFQGWLIPSIYYSTGLTSNYHQVDDHASSINYTHATNIVRLVFALIWELANEPDPTPSFNRDDYRMLTNKFRCRPCGCKADDTVFQNEGTCPDCHMALIPIWENVTLP